MRRLGNFSTGVWVFEQVVLRMEGLIRDLDEFGFHSLGLCQLGLC